MIVLAPLPFLLSAIGRTDKALDPAALQLSIKHVTQRPSFVDHHYFLGLLKLLFNVKQHFGFAPQVHHCANDGVVDLACHLIAPQVRVHSHYDLLCFGSFLSL